jgi:hypothetical protein
MNDFITTLENMMLIVRALAPIAVFIVVVIALLGVYAMGVRALHQPIKKGRIIR